MNASSRSLRTVRRRRAGLESRCARRLRRAAASVLWLLAGLGVWGPSVAIAHGPVAPVATSYLARVTHLPPGLDAKVVDGYVRMWLRVPAQETAIVLDYRGAPYVRFSHSGVEVNHNSSMYYLNQTPVAQPPPASLRATTPPDWVRVSGGHSYQWHDGRLQALAGVALTPGQRFVGTWRIPLLVGGRAAVVSGGLFHAEDPSIVWLWPIVVLLACVVAGWRLRQERVDLLAVRGLAASALVAIALAAVARGLHGRPTVTLFQYVELAVVLALIGWAACEALVRRPRFLACFVIAFLALWEGINLLATLFNGYVLLALPAFVVRTATVVCLGAGAGLLLFLFRLADRAEKDPVPSLERHASSSRSLLLDEEELDAFLGADDGE
jgi:hypothetical protein